MSSNRTIAMWMYKNGGGDMIANKIIKELNERDIDVVNDVNLRHATAKNGHILWNGIKLDKLNLFFSYNAGEQTQYQTYLYQALNRFVTTINTYEAHALTEDKFQTAFVLRKSSIPTPSYKLCHRDDNHHLRSIIKKWDKMIYKPTDGWGGVGLTMIKDESALDMLLPFLNQMDLRYFYVEKFIKYDNTDFRVDIVDGKYVGCYGRKASGNDWRTNISSGGSVFMREPNDEVIDLAKRAANTCRCDIAGVDIIYDQEEERYKVLEVNGIPAFATPEQEKAGLDFNDKKIELIVNMIDRKTRKINK